VQRGSVLGRPLSRVAVALEVERGQADGAVRELTGDVDHRLVDTQLASERGDAIGNLLGEWAEDQRRRQHGLDHP
jgi:hypothetical protein